MKFIKKLIKNLKQYLTGYHVITLVDMLNKKDLDDLLESINTK